MIDGAAAGKNFRVGPFKIGSFVPMSSSWPMAAGMLSDAIPRMGPLCVEFLAAEAVGQAHG